MFVGHSSSMLSANRFMYIYQTIEIDPFIFPHMDLEISLGFILQTVSLFFVGFGDILRWTTVGVFRISFSELRRP